MNSFVLKKSVNYTQSIGGAELISEFTIVRNAHNVVSIFFLIFLLKFVYQHFKIAAFYALIMQNGEGLQIYSAYH